MASTPPVTTPCCPQVPTCPPKHIHLITIHPFPPFTWSLSNPCPFPCLYTSYQRAHSYEYTVCYFLTTSYFFIYTSLTASFLYLKLLFHYLGIAQFLVGALNVFLKPPSSLILKHHNEMWPLHSRFLESHDLPFCSYWLPWKRKVGGEEIIIRETDHKSPV